VKILLASILIAGLATVSCGKKKSTAPEAAAPSTTVENVAAPDSSAEPAANPAPPPRRAAPATPVPQAAPAQASSVDEALVGAVHTFMTAQLKKFIAEQGRMPKDFSEFAGARMDSVPRAPAGMKFVIDETTQEVKVVRK
jgi:type IV secretory pathway VirB10-like protein